MTAYTGNRMACGLCEICLFCGCTDAFCSDRSSAWRRICDLMIIGKFTLHRSLFY